MTQPSLRMLQPAGRQNRRQPHIWYALLAGMLAAGGLLALAKPWGSLAPSGVYAALAAVIGWGCCFAASLAQSASKPLAWTLRLVPWFALGLFFGAGGALEGTKLWINCMTAELHCFRQLRRIGMCVRRPALQGFAAVSWPGWSRTVGFWRWLPD